MRQLIEARDAETGQFQHVILIAEITRVEVAAGLAVIARTGRMSRTERDQEYARFMAQLVQRYAIIPLTANNFETASVLTQRHPLKAYDAVQLAVALRYHQILTVHPLTFVCGDQALVTAAESEGLATTDPFEHVIPEEKE